MKGFETKTSIKLLYGIREDKRRIFQVRRPRLNRTTTVHRQQDFSRMGVTWGASMASFTSFPKLSCQIKSANRFWRVTTFPPDRTVARKIGRHEVLDTTQLLFFRYFEKIREKGRVASERTSPFVFELHFETFRHAILQRFQNLSNRLMQQNLVRFFLFGMTVGLRWNRIITVLTLKRNWKEPDICESMTNEILDEWSRIVEKNDVYRIANHTCAA